MLSVKGTLETMSAPDLLQWLLTCGKTGILRVEGNGIEKRLYFNRGAIVGASSSDPDLAFGQFLLDLGKVDEKTLMRLVRKQRATNILLGRLLTQEGLMTEEEVVEILSLKARETLFELMAWKEGEFEFIDGELPGGDKVPLTLPVDRILFEGIRKAELRRKARKAFPSGTAVPVLTSKQAEQALLEDPKTAPVVPFLSLGMTIRDIARKLSRSVVEVAELLSPYQEKGMLIAGISDAPEIPDYYVEDERTGAVPTPSASGRLGALDPLHLTELAENFLLMGQLEEAMATVERAEQVAPGDAAVKKIAEEIRSSYLSSLWRHFANGEQIPVLTVGVRDLPAINPLFSDDERDIALRLTGNRTVDQVVHDCGLTAFRALRILKSFVDAELIIFR